MDLARPSIDLTGFQEAKKFISLFGDLIEDCVIYFYEIDEFESKYILNHLNVKTSKTLKSLELYGCHLSTLDVLTKPFEEVKILRISSGTSSISQNFGHFFPNLEIFEASWTKISDWSFNSLVSLELSEQDYSEESNIADLIKRSLQLKYLRLDWQNHDILKEANEFIPENLHIWIFERESQNEWLAQDYVYLSTVKNLEVYTFEIDVIPPINFNELEHFTLDLRSRIDYSSSVPAQNNMSNEWEAFINTKVNPNLKTFTLATQSVTEENIIFILETLPHLRSLTIEVFIPPMTIPTVTDWYVNSEMIAENTIIQFTRW